MARSSLAVRAHRMFDATSARAVPVRLFDGHVHRLALLAIAELVVVMLCVYGAVLARFFGFSGTFSAFHTTVGPIWPRALLIAGVTLLGLAAMGLYQLRQRARFTDQRGFKIVGYVRAPGDGADVAQGQLLQHDGDLLRLAMRHKVEEIVVAMDDRRGGFPAEELLECRLRGIAVYDILAFLERETGRMSVELMQPSWLIFSNGFRCDILRLASKRAFDVVISIAVLLVASPIAFLTAIAIFLEDRGPILYRQIRMGQNGREFPMLKFRSMRIDAEPDGQAIWASRNDARLTRVGAWIRRLRIDELPQVFNVLIGHMSLVGPGR